MMQWMRYGAIACLASAFAAAQAVSFTNFNWTGPGTLQDGGAIGTNGRAFILQNLEQVGAGSTTGTLTYTVTAAIGQYFTAVTLNPNGDLENGATASVSALHPGSATAIFSQTQAGGPVLIGQSTTALPGEFTTFNVTMNLTLTGTNPDSYGKISVMQVLYAQQPVPEPMTLTAMAAGIGLLIRKRKGKN